MYNLTPERLHFRGSDLDAFTRLVGTDVGDEVRVRQWY